MGEESLEEFTDALNDEENVEQNLYLEKSPFDFDKFYNSIKNCISENEDVDLVNYLLAYKELHNFFILLGPAFQFLASDVISKIKILLSYQKKENGQLKSSKNFLTVKTMVHYEEENKLLTNPKYVSGCRTLLRLHRGLDFTRKFFGQIYNVENSIKLSHIAKEVYDQTLAEYHSWIVRKAAGVAMQFLPIKSQLLDMISESNEEKLKHIMELFPDAIGNMNIVYDHVQHIYTEHKLLDLP